MARNDVAVLEEEEEDLGAALGRLQIPYKDLGQSSLDDGFDVIKDIIEDSNLLNYDSRESDDPSHNVSVGDSTDLKTFGNASNSPTTASRGRSLAAIRPRNKRGRRKRRCFKSAASLFGVTDKSCLHCGTRDTPLWREGPKGPGTLCNACGVRYRTGRLLPEYRPASSPGFKPNVHSNFHRKVMEIRREKNSPPNSFGNSFGF